MNNVLKNKINRFNLFLLALSRETYPYFRASHDKIIDNLKLDKDSFFRETDFEITNLCFKILDHITLNLYEVSEEITAIYSGVYDTEFKKVTGRDIGNWWQDRKTYGSTLEKRIKLRIFLAKEQIRDIYSGNKREEKFNYLLLGDLDKPSISGGSLFQYLQLLTLSEFSILSRHIVKNLFKINDIHECYSRLSSYHKYDSKEEICERWAKGGPYKISELQDAYHPNCMCYYEPIVVKKT